MEEECQVAEYPNRTDLQNPAMSAARGQTYGKAAQQMRAQQSVPMGRSPVEKAGVQAAKSYPIPGSLGAFTRPTERPNEPITAGANFGPGPDSIGAGIPMLMTPKMQAMEELRAIYQMFPNDDLADLLNAMTTEQE